MGELAPSLWRSFVTNKFTKTLNFKQHHIIEQVDFIVKSVKDNIFHRGHPLNIIYPRKIRPSPCHNNPTLWVSPTATTNFSMGSCFNLQCTCAFWCMRIGTSGTLESLENAMCPLLTALTSIRRGRRT